MTSITTLDTKNIIVGTPYNSTGKRIKLRIFPLTDKTTGSCPVIELRSALKSGCRPLPFSRDASKGMSEKFNLTIDDPVTVACIQFLEQDLLKQVETYKVFPEAEDEDVVAKRNNHWHMMTEPRPKKTGGEWDPIMSMSIAEAVDVVNKEGLDGEWSTLPWRRVHVELTGVFLKNDGGWGVVKKLRKIKVMPQLPEWAPPTYTQLPFAESDDDEEKEKPKKKRKRLPKTAANQGAAQALDTVLEEGEIAPL